MLYVRDKNVGDFGANIDDLAIYFVSTGARKVLAIESTQDTYQLAKTNISQNAMSDYIDLISGGCSSWSEY